MKLRKSTFIIMKNSLLCFFLFLHPDQDKFVFLQTGYAVFTARVKKKKKSVTFLHVMERNGNMNIIIKFILSSSSEDNYL